MSLLALFAFAVHAVAAPVDSAELRREDLMKALQTGGYTILLRHARTDRSFQEGIGTVPVERSAQRNLSAEGVRDAALMGVVLKKYRIPIDEIVASPMFRTRETAEYAAGTPTISMALRVFPSTEETAALVAAPARSRSNRLLVTHHFVIEKYVPGIKPGDIGESEAAVVRATGHGAIALVGRITVSDWEHLAGVPTAAAVEPRAAHHVVTPHAPPHSAYAAPTTAELPDTPIGKLAQRYLHAFNSGDGARMREFIESSLVPNPDRPTAARLETFVKSFQDFGPLVVTAVKASSADEISVGIKAKNGAYVLTATMSADHPGRAASITIGTMQGRHP